MTTATALKPFTGTFLSPGVSLNRCLYTKELIGKAVARMQARIADPDGLPIPMRTHHKAGDNSALIVGRVIGVQQAPDGSARYEARWYDTGPARDLAALVQPADGGPPGLKSVSIHGYFLGPTRRVEVNGETAETADDLEIDFIDFTATPGVTAAVIDTPGSAPPSESAPAMPGRTPISETWEVPVATAITEEAATAAPVVEATSDGPFADPGYQKDKQKRYDLSTKSRAKAAWSYIHQPDNARLYTSAQLKRIKQKIVKALKGFGVTVSAETWLIEAPAPVSESLAECWDMAQPGGDLYISLTNGPTSVSVSSRMLDAHDLDAVGRAAMAGACDALLALDPDMDADIDVPGAPDEDTDDDMNGDEPDGDTEDDMANAPGSACACGCGCAVPHPMAVADGCPCGCGCDVCHAADNSAQETFIPYAVVGQPLLPAHMRVLKETGALDRLQPGEVATAAMVNQAIDQQRALRETADPQTPAPDPAAETAPTTQETAVTDVAPAAETAAPTAPAPTTAQTVQPLAITMTEEQFAQFLGRVAPAAPVAEAAPVTAATPAEPTTITPAAQETASAPASAAAPVVAESYTKAQVDEAVNAAVKDAIPQILAAYGLPQRKGYRTTESDQGGDHKEPTADELWANRADLLLGDIGKVHA